MITKKVRTISFRITIPALNHALSRMPIKRMMVIIAMIDIAKVQGQVHAQSVQKVGELADKNPHEAVSIIRNWLHEDAA